jgi:hypothetical protein
MDTPMIAVCTHAHRVHASTHARTHTVCTQARHVVVALKQRPVHHGDRSGWMHAPTPCAHKHTAVCAHAIRTQWARTQCARTPSERMHGVAFRVHARTQAVYTHVRTPCARTQAAHASSGNACMPYTVCVRTHAVLTHACMSRADTLIVARRRTRSAPRRRRWMDARTHTVCAQAHGCVHAKVHAVGTHARRVQARRVHARRVIARRVHVRAHAVCTHARMHAMCTHARTHARTGVHARTPCARTHGVCTHARHVRTRSP